MLKQLEGAQVDPSLLAYSIVLGKDPNNYQSYTPQHKIGKSQNMESGSSDQILQNWSARRRV